ncbi:MAG: hypothetical protein LQ340_000886 [Diploschistes diacapsis]|nr:MAG: hypothetical protein LQ340_000886 [Diploschistes diacapsis]
MYLTLLALLPLVSCLPSTPPQRTSVPVDYSHANPYIPFHKFGQYENIIHKHDLQDSAHGDGMAYCILARVGSAARAFDGGCMHKVGGEFKDDPEDPFPDAKQYLSTLVVSNSSSSESSNNATAAGDHPNSADDSPYAINKFEWKLNPRPPKKPTKKSGLLFKPGSSTNPSFNVQCAGNHSLYGATLAWDAKDHCRAGCETCMLAAHARGADAALCYRNNFHAECEWGLSHHNAHFLGEVECTADYDGFAREWTNPCRLTGGARWRVLSADDEWQPQPKLGADGGNGSLWVEYAVGYGERPDPKNQELSAGWLEGMLGKWEEPPRDWRRKKWELTPEAWKLMMGIGGF